MFTLGRPRPCLRRLMGFSLGAYSSGLESFIVVVAPLYISEFLFL